MFSSQQRGPPPPSVIRHHWAFTTSASPFLYQSAVKTHSIKFEKDLKKTVNLQKVPLPGCGGPVCGPGREPTALLLPCQSPVPLLRSRSSALIESHRTWNFFTLWGPVNMMSMWAGSLFDPVSWLQFKVILSGVPWPLLHAHRVFSSFAWTRHNKSTLITGP